MVTDNHIKPNIEICKTLCKIQYKNKNCSIVFEIPKLMSTSVITKTGIAIKIFLIDRRYSAIIRYKFLTISAFPFLCNRPFSWHTLYISILLEVRDFNSFTYTNLPIYWCRKQINQVLILHKKPFFEPVFCVTLTIQEWEQF